MIALCVNFIGDGLRDAFDPRQKKKPSERAMARAARAKGPAPVLVDTTASTDAPSVTVAGEAVYTGDIVNYHDPRPEEPGDVQHKPLDPER